MVRTVCDKPYSEDRYSYYGILKNRIKGKTLPLVSENANGDTVILLSGHLDDGMSFIVLKTLQKNDWIEVATYYEDGTVEVEYEK